MRILHDPQRCASTGMCEAVAPDVFEIRGDGELQVLDPQPPEGLRGPVAEAVAACPTGALQLEG